VISGIPHLTFSETVDFASRTSRAKFELSDDEIHLWRVEADSTNPAEARAAWPILSDEERQRAMCHRNDLVAREFIASRAAQRSILGRYMECDPRAVALMHDEQGRPAIGAEAGRTLTLSISRSRGMTLIGLACGGNIGIDVEHVPPPPGCGDLPWGFVREHAPPEVVLHGPSCPRDDVKFYVAWTRLEAYAKACANGLTGLRNSYAAAASRTWMSSFSLSEDFIGALAETGRPPRAVIARQYEA